LTYLAPCFTAICT